MKIGMTKVVEVEVKTMRIHMKVRDEFSGSLLDQDGQTIVEKENVYVPGFFPGGDSDYLVLNIDIETGQITNWTPPAKWQIEEFLEDK